MGPDLETGFADVPAGVAETVLCAIEQGLAGCSVEDFTGWDNEPIHDAGIAADRIAEAAHSGPVHLVLTARRLLHGPPIGAGKVHYEEYWRDH